MPDQINTLSIYAFDDGVEFIKAWLKMAKRGGESHRSFMKKAGFTSTGLLSELISRKKKLSVKLVNGFSQAMNLGEEEQQYFQLLVKKLSAKGEKVEQEIINRLTLTRHENLFENLEEGQLKYFSDWKYIIVREYIQAKGVIYNPREITRDLLQLHLDQVGIKKILKRLVKWKLVNYDKMEQCWKVNPSEKVLTFNEVPHSLLNDTKKKMIKAAISAMELLPKEEREISMSVLGVSEKDYKIICDRLNKLREEIVSMTDQSNSDRLVILNFNLFPVAKIGANIKGKGNGK